MRMPLDWISSIWTLFYLYLSLLGSHYIFAQERGYMDKDTDIDADTDTGTIWWDEQFQKN